MYSISKDIGGVCRLTLRNATLEDSGEYCCKILKQTDKTETVLTIIGTYRFLLIVTIRFDDIRCVIFRIKDRVHEIFLSTTLKFVNQQRRGIYINIKKEYKNCDRIKRFSVYK